MNNWYLFLIGFVTLLGVGTMTYQLYRITVIDAAGRGLKHPGLWGLVALGGKNGGGLLLYLIGRRKYPSVLSDKERREIETRKKKLGVGLLFFGAGVIATMYYMVFAM